MNILGKQKDGSKAVLREKKLLQSKEVVSPVWYFRMVQDQKKVRRKDNTEARVNLHM